METASPEIHQPRSQISFASLADGSGHPANPSAPVEGKLAGGG